MFDRARTNLTDRMIASLEEANTRSYQQLRWTDQSSSPAEQDVGHHRSSQQPARKHRLSPAIVWFFALVGLVLPACVYIKAFVWEPSYKDATKLAIARWVNASIAAQPARQNNATPELVVPPEVDRRLQMMAEELADARQRIEQLKRGQDEITRNDVMLAEQFKAGRQQIARDNEKVADQLSSGLGQMAEREAALAVQLRAMQDQLAEAASSRAINPARKPSRRKRVSSPRAGR